MWITFEHTNFTSRLFVLGFEFLCREVGKVVIIKWVPCRLHGGIGGTASSKNSSFSFALVLSCITDIELNRLGSAWLRYKRSTDLKKTKNKKPHDMLHKTNRRIWSIPEVYSSTYWSRAASTWTPCGCCEASLSGTPAMPFAVASLSRQ